MAEPIAIISLLKLADGEPGVKLTAMPEFMELDAVERCMFIAAAIQLCGMAIDAICSDNPDLADEIRERFSNVSLSPSTQRMN